MGKVISIFCGESQGVRGWRDRAEHLHRQLRERRRPQTQHPGKEKKPYLFPQSKSIVQKYFVTECRLRRQAVRLQGTTQTNKNVPRKILIFLWPVRFKSISKKISLFFCEILLFPAAVGSLPGAERRPDAPLHPRLHLRPERSLRAGGRRLQGLCVAVRHTAHQHTGTWFNKCS